MTGLDHLRSTNPPYVHLIVQSGTGARGMVATPPKGFIAKQIDGGKCRTKASLLETFAKVLAFPAYFGGTWDAFEECLNDLDWLPAEGYLLVVNDAHEVLSKHGKEYQTFLEILEAAGGEWASARKTPFHTLLVVSPTQARVRKDWRARPLER